PQGIARRVGEDDLVAFHLEQLAERQRSVLVILDQQDAGLVIRGRCAARSLTSLGCGRDGRELDLEACTHTPTGAENRDPTTVRFDDRLRDGEAETETESTRRIVTLLERFEEAGEELRGDARPVVLDDELDVLLSSVPRRDDDASFGRSV